MPEENVNNTQLQSSLNQAQINTPNVSQMTPEIPPTQSSRSHKLKIILLLGALIIFIIIISGGVYAYLAQQKKSKISEPNLSSKFTSTITPTSTLNNDNALEPPELYPEFEWIKIDEENPNSLKNGNPDNTILYLEYDPINYEITGDEWIYEIEVINNDEETNLISGFNEYYSNFFEKNGWSISKDYNNKEIGAIAASGPGGDIIGYIKIVNDKARLVVVHDNNGILGRPDYKCPCALSFNMFVSDIIDLNELLDVIN